MQTQQHGSLTAALAVQARELVAFVGGGGKTGALQMLAMESAGAGCLAGGVCEDCGGAAVTARVLVTTTTAMFLNQLQAVGPVMMGPERPHLLPGLVSALGAGGPVAAARDLAEGGKVVGLPADWVDELWATGAADLIVVEADGSRGLSLKAFGPHEPHVPEAATLIVQVAGLDALDASLGGDQVHRAGLLVEALAQRSGSGRVPKIGDPITPDLFIAALRLQLGALRGRWPAARIVTLLNKAEGGEAVAAGLAIARQLIERPPGEVAPEAVVVGSLRERTFTRSVPSGRLVTAVVLAAGAASRMGCQKLLLPVAGRPMVESALDAATHSRAAETVVVTGSEAAAVRAAVGGHQARIVRNPDYALGMSASLRVGVAAARPDCDAVLFLLGDQPFVTSSIIDQIIGRFAETGAGMVRPLVAGRPAHPVLIASRYFPEVMALEGDVGAREILARHPGEVVLVELPDERAALDLDTPGDYEAAR